MSTYDFTTLRSRLHMGASKWVPMERAGVTDPDVIPFSVADMDLLVAPEITAALREAADFGVYGYTGMDDAFRSALMGWMERRHGWTVDPGWLVSSFGVVHAAGQAIHAFTRPGDAVVAQTPAYPPFKRITENTGRTFLADPLRRTDHGYELDLDHLEDLCRRPETKLLLLCSPHNPTGRVWTRAELTAIAHICRRHDVLIFSDEIHCDFIAPGHTHTVLATLDEETAHRCVMGTSASKTFNLAGLATATTIIPDQDLRRRFRAKTDGYTGGFSGYFGLAAARAAYEQGEPWLSAFLEHLKGNFELCKAFLADRFPSVWTAPWEGTYLLWADFSSLGLDPEAQMRFMRDEAGLWLDEGTMFGPEGTGFERFVLACPRHHLEKALERLDDAARRQGLPR